MYSTRDAHLHTDRSPPHMKKTTSKSTRSTTSSKTASIPKFTIKAAKATKKPRHEDEEEEEDVVVEKQGDDDDDDDDDMGPNFLQFCAMCEKQIVVPNSSILYCSESCRRRDGSTPASYPYHFDSLRSPITRGSHTYTEPDGANIPTYVPALRPTPRIIPDGRIPTKFHDGKSDLDPTEWKPAEPTLGDGKPPLKLGDWKPKLRHHPSSEAASFLNKFHTSSDSLTPKRRLLTGHSRTTVSSRSIPGLSHTPTASTSSEESLSGTPYEFVARPAISMPTASRAKVASGIKNGNDLTYEKERVRVSSSSASGSLKKLLGSAAEGM